MEETRTIKDRLKGHGKWLGSTFVGLVFVKLFDPLLDWALDTFLWATNSAFSGVNDSIYRNAAKVQAQSDSNFTVIAFIYGLAILAYVFTCIREKSKSTIFLSSCGYGTVLAVFMLTMLLESANRIKNTTLNQLDIIKPYSSETSKLYSQFLLVRTEADYNVVWNEIMAIAQQEDVVLPRFEDLSQ